MNRLNRLKLAGLLLVAGLLPACSGDPDPWREDPQTGRWFTPAQVAQGAQLYQRYCASCHGADAVGAPNWTQPDGEGLYPPPPLNGTAHAWHHPLPVLKRVIQEGSRGRMPAWKATLDDGEIIAVIAWFQSLWPEEGYRIWQRRHPH